MFLSVEVINSNDVQSMAITDMTCCMSRNHDKLMQINLQIYTTSRYQYNQVTIMVWALIASVLSFLSPVSHYRLSKRRREERTSKCIWHWNSRSTLEAVSSILLSISVMESFPVTPLKMDKVINYGILLNEGKGAVFWICCSMPINQCNGI